MRLAHERSGEGPPLVLLHGVGHRRQAWDAVTGLLTPRREVIAVDLPGHGESPPMRGVKGSPVDAMAEEVIGLLDELGLERPHVAGNSLGGALALGIAAAGRAATVTALSPAGFWAVNRQIAYTKATFKAMQLIGASVRPVAPALCHSTAGRALMYSTIISRPSRMSARQAVEDLTAFLDAKEAMNAVLAAAGPFAPVISADVPLTIGWGTRDRLLPPSQVRVVRQRLPHARCVPLRGCGHVPMTDDPALVARVLLNGSDDPAAAGHQAR